MVRTTLLLAALSLGACEGSEYDRPITMFPHGDAVRANMAAQVINPNPPRRTNGLTDGAVAVRAYTAYQDGEVKELREARTQESTVEPEE